MKIQKRWILKIMSFWPPYIGAGIRVKKISQDYRTIEVEMKLRFWNQNYVGTHFGGSLFSMCDPFFMLILIENLGRGYIVWDKSASIKFKRPAKEKVSAVFHISDEEILRIKKHLESNEKIEPEYLVNITDESGQVVAEVKKLISVKKKR